MPKPVCVKCRCFYRPHKNGYYLIEGMPRGIHAGVSAEEGRGLRRPELWEPYKLWVGDLWKCPDCEHEIVVGFGSRPTAEHYQLGFKEECAAHSDLIQINDC